MKKNIFLKLKFFLSLLLSISLLYPSVGLAQLGESKNSADIEVRHNFEKETGTAWLDATEKQKSDFLKKFKKFKENEAKKQRLQEKLEQQELNQNKKAKDAIEKRKKQRKNQELKALRDKEKEEEDRRKRLKKAVNQMKKKMGLTHKKRK